MDKREFIEQLAQDLSVARPDMEFSVQEVEKLQGAVLYRDFYGANRFHNQCGFESGAVL